MTTQLLPRARLVDVLLRRAPLVGSRCATRLPRGLISPVEARLRMGLDYGDLFEEEVSYLENASVRRNIRVVLHAALSALFSSRNGGQAGPARPFIVSARVDNVTASEAIELILAPARDRARVVAFAHAHALNLAALDRRFAEELARADLVLPDGIGIRLAAHLLGTGLRSNVNGTDLIPLLSAAAAERKIPIVLIGGAEGVAQRAAAGLRACHPLLQIPLVSHGFLDADQATDLADRIRALGRCVVLIGMGSPIQEHWVRRYLADIPNITTVTVGGLFDFVSGAQRRAPVALREFGLEWAYRLSQEPRRLAVRYLLGNPLFLALTLSQRILGRRWARNGPGGSSPEPLTER